jgi:hypothetical protein
VLDQEVRRKRHHEARYLVSNGERVEEVVRLFQERQVSTRDALDQLTELLEEARTQKTADSATSSASAFSVYWLLERRNAPNAHGVARNMASGSSHTCIGGWRRIRAGLCASSCTAR